MPVIGLLIILVLPIIYGTFISRVFKDDNPKWTVFYASGFLAMILALLVSTLAALKLDANLEKASLIFMAVLGAGAIVSFPFFLLTIIQKKMPKVKIQFLKNNLWFLIPATIVGVATVFLYVPSVVNDNTWEIVSTTLATGRIYEYSSMTGKAMEMGTAGLPIFNKIYVMPLFYTYFAKVFHLDMWLLGGIVVPLVVFTINLSLVYLVSLEVVSDNNRPYFMLAYLMILLAGTYLPSGGIPVTVGYAVLREGYSGYAICYGILAPLFLYWMLKGKRIRAWIFLFSGFPLVRLDRIAYAVKEPVKSLREVNSSGKLIALFLAALMAAVMLTVNKKEKIKWTAFIVPSVAISMMITRLKNYIEGKTKIVVYSLGISFVIFSCVIFRPFYDADYAKGITKQDEGVRDCLLIISETVSDVNIWAYEDFMFEARRVNGMVKTLYGRDDMNVTLAGVDYEPVSEYVSDYAIFMKNKTYGIDYLIQEHSDMEVVEAALKEGVNTIVLPQGSNREGYEATFETVGYAFSFETDEYIVYVRKDI